MERSLEKFEKHVKSNLKHIYTKKLKQQTFHKKVRFSIYFVPARGEGIVRNDTK